MRCSVFKGLLQDYLNNELDPKIKKQFQEHVNSCEKCAEALQFYKSYFREIGNIGTVDAPPDFLKNVKERIRTRSPLNDFLKKLFLPFSLKIPLELAGVTALLLFIILVIRPALRRYPQENGPLALRDNGIAVPESVAKMPAGKELPAAGEAFDLKQRKDASVLTTRDKLTGDLKKPAYGTAAVSARPESKDDGLINVAILPRDSRPAEDEAVLKSEDQEADSFTRGMEVKEKSLKRSASPVRASESKIMEEQAETEQDMLSLSRKNEGKKMKARQAANFSTNDLVRINAIVTNLKGRILPREYQKTVQNQSFILIEMPMYNYRQFLEQLNKNYEVQKPESSLSAQERKKARIQLQYQSIQK